MLSEICIRSIHIYLNSWDASCSYHIENTQPMHLCHSVPLNFEKTNLVACGKFENRRIRYDLRIKTPYIQTSYRNDQRPSLMSDNFPYSRGQSLTSLKSNSTKLIFLPNIILQLRCYTGFPKINIKQNLIF